MWLEGSGSGQLDKVRGVRRTTWGGQEELSRGRDWIWIGILAV